MTSEAPMAPTMDDENVVDGSSDVIDAPADTPAEDAIPDAPSEG